MFTDEMANHKNFQTDMSQLRNSIIISMVTSLELLIADLFKDFIEEVDQSDIINKRSINYNDLLKIGNIEEARRFLLDEFIEELLRGSFLSWIKEIDNKMKIPLASVKVIKESNAINLINETFQRRHLLIHNGGIVNDLYLTKIDSNLKDGVYKSDELDSSNSYITSRINTFKKLGIVLIYLYGEKKYRTDKNQIVEMLSNLLLELGNNGCEGSRYILRKTFEEKEVNHSNQLVSMFNYYLSYKNNDELEEVRDELERIDVESLSIEYKMAKNILLDNTDDAISNFKTFADGLSDNDFFVVIDWPLLKSIKNNQIVKGYINDRTHRAISNEGSERIEEYA